MAGRRGANGRFSGGDPEPAAGELPPLLDLTVEAVDLDPAESTIPQLESPALDGAPAPDLEAGEDAGDPALAVALARGLDELVGLVFGASFRADPAAVEAVGDAALPVMRRAFSFFHAAELAESAIPAPVREITVLAVRAYAAWGDAAAIVARQTLDEIRGRVRGEDSSAEAGSTSGAGDGLREPGGSNGLGLDGAAQVPGTAQTVPAAWLGPDSGAENEVSRHPARRSGSRGRRS